MILVLAALLVAAFTVPAPALENKFGGYWRTRFMTNQEFSGDDSEALDFTMVDTRTRLYYTAILNDNLKFVNKFEFDADWGDTVLGDIGADGQIFEIKNSYVDFNLGPVNFTIGIQNATLARGFIFADDFSGAVVAYKSDVVTVPFIWIKGFEGGMGKDANDADFDYYAIAPSFSPMEMLTITPYILWATSDNADTWAPTTHLPSVNSLSVSSITLAGFEDVDVYYVGVDVDVKLDPVSIWFTGIYQGGNLDFADDSGDVDVSAWLLAAGANAGMGPVDIHGQFFYATGDDDYTDDDVEAYFVPSQHDWSGQSYYWAEILGYGIFDDQVPTGSCADKITNIIAVNAGVTFKPMPKLSITGDIWYAQLDEEDANGEDELGWEIDFVLTYELVEGLNLDLVGAYLFAGDAVSINGENEEDPWEAGARLSLSF
jgi:hypothetical protein